MNFGVHTFEKSRATILLMMQSCIIVHHTPLIITKHLLHKKPVQYVKPLIFRDGVQHPVFMIAALKRKKNASICSCVGL